MVLTLMVVMASQMYACVARCFSRVQLSVTPWTVAHQAPLSTGFDRQEYWSGLPCAPPGDLPDPGIGSASLTSPALAVGFFTTRPLSLTCIKFQTCFSASCLNPPNLPPPTHIFPKRKRDPIPFPNPYPSNDSQAPLIKVWGD